MIVLGVDPGMKGAMAAVSKTAGLFILHSATPMLLFQPRNKPTLSTPKMDDWLSQFKRLEVGVIEDVHAMPKQGVASSFQFGRMFGAAESLMHAHCPRCAYVSPGVWKREMGLSNNKVDSLDFATSVFGQETGERWWPKKKDEGIAEAALLAVWWITANG